MVNKNDILNELIEHQRKDVSYNKKLSYRDLTRIIKYVNKSIFDDKCCVWEGYISSPRNDNSFYINFFFKKKKINLQKLLYLNYVGDLASSECVKYTCVTQGKCCNVNHFIKHSKCNITDANSDNETDTESENDSDNSFEEINAEDFIVTF